MRKVSNMVYEKNIDGVRCRLAVINGERQNFWVSEMGKFYFKNGKPKKISKPSGNEKYFTISCKKNGKNTKTSVHRCLQETFNGGAIEDNNWTKLRPECFSKEQWMGFTEEQRIFLSRSGIHVDHKNGKKHDNDLTNLQYLWASDNIAKGNSSSDPVDQAKVMFKKTQALVKKVCYKRPDGTLNGDSKHKIDLTSYDNMISFIREELRVLDNPRIISLSKFQWRRLRTMKQFVSEHKIAA